MGRFYLSKNNAGFGFTLIELLIAIAIIGVLASSLVLALDPVGQIAKSRDAERKSDLKQIGIALDAYYSDNNRYPYRANWRADLQPYMSVIPEDPTPGKSYNYETPAPTDGSSYKLSAQLERCSGSQVTAGTNCAASYNYAVTSSNTSAVAFAVPTSAPPANSPPTPTPANIPAGTQATSTPIPTATPVAPTATPIPASLSYKRVFVSSQTYKGDLDGFSGADNKCQTLATNPNVNLGGTWKAWLSDNSSSPATNTSFNKSTVPYKLVDGTFVANNWNDLVTSKLGNYLTNAISKDENGNIVPSSRSVWTNTNTDGSRISQNNNDNCRNWRDMGAGFLGVFGFSSQKALGWTAANNNVCSTISSLYCFEQ